MAKMYTLDNKLLTEKPEIRIGDKVYAVDDRAKTVKKLKDLKEEGDNASNIIFEMALGKDAAKEIEAMELSMAAEMSLVEIITAAMLGEDTEVVKARFQKSAEK